jgi:hypothetical protein
MLGGTEGGGQTQERPSPSGCGLHGSESTDGHLWNTLTCLRAQAVNATPRPVLVMVS